MLTDMRRGTGGSSRSGLAPGGLRQPEAAPDPSAHRHCRPRNPSPSVAAACALSRLDPEGSSSRLTLTALCSVVVQSMFKFMQSLKFSQKSYPQSRPADNLKSRFGREVPKTLGDKQLRLFDAAPVCARLWSVIAAANVFNLHGSGTARRTRGGRAAGTEPP